MRYFPQHDDSPPFSPGDDPDFEGGGQHVGNNASYHFGPWRDSVPALVYEFRSTHGILRCPWYEVWLRGEVVYSSMHRPTQRLIDHLKLEACE